MKILDNYAYICNTNEVKYIYLGVYSYFQYLANYCLIHMNNRSTWLKGSWKCHLVEVFLIWPSKNVWVFFLSEIKDGLQSFNRNLKPLNQTWLECALDAPLENVCFLCRPFFSETWNLISPNWKLKIIGIWIYNFRAIGTYHHKSFEFESRSW